MPLTDIGTRFESYREAIPGGAIAYWIGLHSPKASPLQDGDALGMCSTMSYQFDVEEQADRIGYVFPPDAEWRREFEPAAPIQLTDGWCPIDVATQQLGVPASSDVAFDVAARRLGAVLVWTASQLAELGPSRRRGEPGDERRFVGLVEVVISRARERRWGALLVVRPGWSYEETRTPSKALRAAWSRAGFATDDRRPRPASAAKAP